MTILVAYVPRPEGQAALDKGIEMARLFNQDLVVVNASAATGDNESIAAEAEVKRIESQLAASGVKAEFMQFARGNTPVEEIETLVKSRHATMLIIGLRKRSPVGKLFLGSVAQDILLSVSCPVLAVKAQ
ncbi:MAG: universal stress protein [Rhodocyclaceae bacterium]|jgi:nucleotide-binding universal stress UspA family protein|nr:universal stress protein [Rhodocyclaceae bacterium]